MVELADFSHQKKKELADFQQRCDGQQYICVHHILLALSQTSVADSVTKIVDIAKMKPILCESSADCFAVNNFHLTSAHLASLLGDQEIGLEHLILATVLGKWDAILKRESFVEFLECVKKGDISLRGPEEDHPLVMGNVTCAWILLLIHWINLEIMNQLIIIG